MKKKKPTSDIVALFKTFAFFGVLGGLAWLGLWTYNYFNPTEIPKKASYKYVDFMELGGYDYYTPFPGETPDPTLLAANKIPDDIMALNGAKVMLMGYMLPGETDSEGKVSEFALNGNYDMCYYGAPSQINNWVQVRMENGKRIPFSHTPVTAYGILEVGEETKDGQIISVYRLRGESVMSNRKLY